MQPQNFKKKQTNRECKSGFDCEIISCKKTNKSIIRTESDGRCYYAEVYSAVERLKFNIFNDCFRQKAEGELERISVWYMRRRCLQ